MRDKKQQLIFGIHPVTKALKNNQRECYKIVVKEGASNSRIGAVLPLAKARKVRVETLPAAAFNEKYRAHVHQSIIGYFSEKESLDVADLIERALSREPAPTLVLLDEIQDPQNLGAILRSAEALGIQGIVLPRRRSAPLNESAAKTSAGAIEHLDCATVSNLTHAVDLLKKAGFWIVGVDAAGGTPCHAFSFDMPHALIIGGEAKGIRPLLRKRCDFSVTIPMTGATESLNASAAAAVIFYEILRQKKSAEPQRDAD